MMCSRKRFTAGSKAMTSSWRCPILCSKSCPRTRFAYRDRGVLELNATAVTKLTLVRGGSTTVLEPSEAAGAPNQWRMVAPVKAPADSRAVTQVLALLSNLRADEFVADLAKSEKSFGLDQPSIVVSWQLDNASASASAASGEAVQAAFR